MNDRPDARTRILSRLSQARGRHQSAAPPPAARLPAPLSAPARLERFRAMLEASRAEVHAVTEEDWPIRLRAILAGKGVARLLYAPDTDAGCRLAAAWGDDQSPALVAYDRPVEAMGSVLIDGVDAALTHARGGIAETGTLIVWPTPDEPRLMSLLPPIHVALVEEGALTDRLAETMRDQDWESGMPTNVVLISGPSKTADIEQTLAYGIHGPKELIVMVIRR
jgi:L-lactate dehydrogenase complex protein LldG